jgi:D-tyrosyl-tRNA(Tyr) deacylase
VQRVRSARVETNGETIGNIGQGLAVLLGVAEGDGEGDGEYLAEKVAHLRIFEDAEGKLNQSLKDIGGAALVVSNFTLCGDCRKGRRPSFTEAASAEIGRRLCECFLAALRARGVPVETGEFQSSMQVILQNDGPVTLLLDSRKQF